MSDVYLGLGTNLGNRIKNMDRTIAGLEAKVIIGSVSPIYETAAWGIEDQPDFLNLCVAGETSLSPWELLHFVKDLEIEIGRVASVRWGPRLIDIDILFFGDLVMDEPGLTIPHKGLPNRATVLIPLADIAPELRHPVSNKTVAELYTQVDKTGVWPFDKK